MIKRIEAIIVDLTDKADAAERIAQIKGEAYSIAKDAYDQKAAQVATLQSQADEAHALVSTLEGQLGAAREQHAAALAEVSCVECGAGCGYLCMAAVTHLPLISQALLTLRSARSRYRSLQATDAQAALEEAKARRDAQV